MKKSLYLFFFILFFPIAATAATAEPTALAIVQTALTAATDGIFQDLATWGVRLLSLFIMVQFIMTNINLLGRDSDLAQVWAKFLGSMFWFTFCFYVMVEGAPFMTTAASFFYEKAASIAGGSFTPGYALNFGLTLTNNLLVALDNSQSILSSLNPFPSIMLGLVSVVILFISTLIAFKIFMVIAETSIVIALSPLSFALLGLNALKDQGLAPLKYLVAMGYRAIILGAVIKCMELLGVHISKVFDNLPNLTDTGVWTPIWASVMGYSLLGFLAYRADSIATMLASGSSQMSTGDAAAVGAAAAAAGGAVGAMVGGAISGAAGAVTKPAQSMGDFIKSLGVSGQVMNASHAGAGFTPSGPAPIPPPSASMGPTNSRGVPIPPPSEASTTGGGKVGNTSQSAKSVSTPALASGEKAGIGGANPPPAQNNNLQEGGSGIFDKLGNANQHLAQENAVVSISLNTNAE